MNVLHIMWSLEFGGIGRLVLDLCREQRKRGIDARIMVGQASGRMMDEFSAAGIPVFDAQLINGFDPGWFNASRIKEEFQNASVINIHSFSPAFSRMLRHSKAPIIFTDHGNYGLGRKRTWRDHVKFMMLAKFLKRHVNYMTFNSNYTQGLAEQHFALKQFPTGVIYNGIDFDRYHNIASTSSVDLPCGMSEKFVIGTTSRFVGFKRVDRLIRAFAAMQNRTDCRLLLVGDGPLRQQYEQLVEELGVAEQTIFTGYCANVQDYQAAMDVCVFPSCGEPFGLVAVETLALGKPTVVLSDGGGIIEIIEPIEPCNVVDGEAGLTRRLEEYQRAWQAGTICDPDRIEGRQNHARRFDVKRMAEEFANVYAQCLGKVPHEL